MKVLIRENLQTKEINIYGTDGKLHTEEFFEKYFSDTGGVGLVNCLMKVMDMPFKEAVREALDGELGQGERTDSVPNYAPLYRKAEPTVPEPKSEFIMPEKGENNHLVFSYLMKTRHIDANVVNEFIRAGVLFQDTKGNAIFLHKENGKPCGAEIHGTSGKSYTVGNSRYADFSADRKVIPTEPYIAEMLSREMNESGVRFAGYVYEKNANIVTDSAGFEAISGKIAEIQSRSIDRAAIDGEVKSKLKNYKGVAPGTSESYFSYDKGEPKKAFVFESSIDLDRCNEQCNFNGNFKCNAGGTCRVQCTYGKP